ncbi:MAG TPA: hypothetical protein RMH99_28465 [Sandaracinaceae bacterium LLY-WYZ-13_1]|nr:hypothetical protein [Sandaracinaceae bacterium LLY-WYZ-13_1]
MDPRKLAIPALALALAGCATGITLTDEGEDVRHVQLADMPTGCNLLGDVAIGIPPDAARPRTEEQLHTLMRNKAGELGGTHVIVESTDERTGDTGEIYYAGRGVAYACPEAAMEAPEEETAGGEALAEEEGTAPAEETADEEPGGDTAAEDDPIVEDLLGED